VQRAVGAAEHYHTHTHERKSLIERINVVSLKIVPGSSPPYKRGGGSELLVRVPDQDEVTDSERSQ
jgi:hypothetical protein